MTIYEAALDEANQYRTCPGCFRLRRKDAACSTCKGRADRKARKERLVALRERLQKRKEARCD